MKAYIDQLTIGNKISFDDFGASVSSRKIGLPKKKSITETVPFSNKTYDFSKINGELYWEERELEYSFEIMADTPEELEEMKAAFSAWVMNVMEEELHDPFIPDYHFIGTFDDITPEDDEGLDKTTITVKFKAYPYKVANVAKTYTYSLAAGSTLAATIVNDSSHRITPTITASKAITITKGSVMYSVNAGETTDSSFMLETGVTTLTLKSAAAATVEIRFFEEVF